jgi:hypothetical protein
MLCSVSLASPAYADSFFQWGQGNGAQKMLAAADNYCYLTRVRGKFMGYGERIRIRVVNGFWQLEGQSQQQGVAAWARCFARSEIKAPAGAERWSSEEFSATADNPGNGCVDTNPRLAWWGDGATVMTLVTGALRGSGERITINQSGDPFGPSTLVLHSCQKQLGVGAHSFFVGKPQSGRIARFIGPGGTGTPGQAGEYVSLPNQNVMMAPLTEAFCYFTEISGAFNGAGESVTILPGSDANGVSRWELQARHASGSGVSARVRCYARNQI